MSENKTPDIAAMSPREHVRHRPHMYFGTTDSSALHQLVAYILEVPIDAALLEECSHIEVILHPNQTVTISDNSPGIPLDIVQSLGFSKLELQMSQTRMALPRNFETFTVNAVCTELTAQVKRDGYLWQQTYAEGVRTSDVIQIRPLKPNESTGTTITFTPDFTVLQPNEFSYSALARRLRELAYLVPGLTLTLKDEREQPEGSEVSFCFPNGFVDFLTYVNRESTPIHSLIHKRGDVEATTNNGKAFTIGVEIAFQYVEQPSSTVLSYVNLHETLDGGTHVEGLLLALQDFVSERIDQGVLGEIHRDGVDKTFVVQDLTAVIHIMHPHPSIESQLVSRLINPDVESAVFKIASQAMQEFKENHPDDMQRLVDHLLARKQVRDKRRSGF